MRKNVKSKYKKLFQLNDSVRPCKNTKSLKSNNQKLLTDFNQLMEACHVGYKYYFG